MQKTQNFSVLISKEIRKFGNYGYDDIITISYKIEFIDSARFIVSSLSIINLSMILHMEFTNLNGKIVIVFLNMKVLRTI